MEKNFERANTGLGGIAANTAQPVYITCSDGRRVAQQALKCSALQGSATASANAVASALDQGAAAPVIGQALGQVVDCIAC